MQPGPAVRNNIGVHGKGTLFVEHMAYAERSRIIKLRQVGNVNGRTALGRREAVEVLYITEEFVLVLLAGGEKNIAANPVPFPGPVNLITGILPKLGENSFLILLEVHKYGKPFFHGKGLFLLF